MGFARNIEALILKFDITQNGLADTVKVSPATVSRWVKGTMGIRPAHVRRICEAFELRPDDLLSDEHGLAAQMDGTAAAEGPAEAASGDRVATLPFLSGAQAIARRRGAGVGASLRVEVPACVASRHPGAFVVAVAGDAAEGTVAIGCHAVVDPETPPESGSLVAVGPTPDGGVELRMWRRDDRTPAPSPAESAGPAEVLGPGVWFQAPGLLG